MGPSNGDFDDIKAFCERLKSGITVHEFLTGFQRVIMRLRDGGPMNDYRLGRNRNGIELKKLRDEVSPVARFVGKHASRDDRISFGLDNAFPDCTLCCQCGDRWEIDVTLARALARFHEMTELNKCGMTKGLLDLQDGASKSETAAAKTQDSRMYSTSEAIDQMVRAIDIAAAGKREHKGRALLIEVAPACTNCPQIGGFVCRRGSPATGP